MYFEKWRFEKKHLNAKNMSNKKDPEDSKFLEF